MAEGWTRHLWGGRIDAYSAGSTAHGIDPLATRVMAEAGVDITGQRSKTVDELSAVPFDLVVTLCGNHEEVCPFFPGRTKRIHAGFDDPPALARSAAGEEEALAHYRRVRDEIRRFVESIPSLLDMDVR
jgi:arsenate reductase